MGCPKTGMSHVVVYEWQWGVSYSITNLYVCTVAMVGSRWDPFLPRGMPGLGGGIGEDEDEGTRKEFS